MNAKYEAQKERELIKLLANKNYEVWLPECSGSQELLRTVYGIEEDDLLQPLREYPIWTPLDCFDAAHQLKEALRANKNSNVPD